MKIFSIVITVLCLVAIGLLGFGYYFIHQPSIEKVNSLTVELEACQDTNDQIISDISALKIKNDKLEKTIEELTMEKEKKEAKIDTLKTTYENLVEDLEKEIQEGEIKVTRLANKLSVNMVDKILFRSGEAKITKNGLEVLSKVGKILKKTRDKRIRVEGHTDNAPIGWKIKDKFPTNWELSTARATNVVRHLQEEVKIPPERLEAVGLAQYQPVSSNKTKQGRAKNRRIEIILVPDMGGY